MTTMLLVAAVLVVPSAVRAQNTSCPIQPVQVKDTDSQLTIVFDGTARKTIATYKFILTFFDLNGNPHSFPQPLLGNVQMPGRGHRHAIWQTKLAQHFLFPYAQVFLQKVTFTDGTSWTDDGFHSCSVISGQE